MYSVKKLYIKFEDDDGHSYLIDKDEFNKFDNCCDDILEAYEEHKDIDLYYEQYNDLLEAFECVHVEGESLYTVLPEDVKSV